VPDPFAPAAWNAALDGALSLLDGGVLRLVSADGDVLAELRLRARAFAPAVSGVAVLNAPEPNAAARSGTAAGFRCYSTDNVLVLWGTCGAAEPGKTPPVVGMLLNDAEIHAGGLVSLVSWSVRAPGVAFAPGAAAP
jgi:hypothetical protein